MLRDYNNIEAANPRRDFTLFKAGNEILCLPKAIVDKWTPAQHRWAESTYTRMNPNIEARVIVAAKRYNELAGDPWDLMKVMCTKTAFPPTSINQFRFWFRVTLTRLGLI